MSAPPSPGLCLVRTEPDRWQATMVNDAASLAAGQAALRAFLGTVTPDERVRFQVELAFEELVTNVARHAYDGRPESSARIDAEITVDAATLRLRIEDDGPPFDPAGAPMPALPISLTQAAVGGLGIRFIRASTTRLDHERIDGRNRTTAWLSR